MENNEYVFKTTPYEHQFVCWKNSNRNKNYAILADLGTGKTKMAIDTAAFMYQNKWINAVMIFGNNGSYMNWVDAFNEHCPIATSIGVWSSKNGKKKTEEMEKVLIGTGLRIFLMNIEALSFKKGFERAYEFCRKNKTMGIIDESTTISNAKAERTKKAMKIRDVTIVRRILTGSSVDNGPFKAWSQFEFLKHGALGFTSYYAFKAEFADLKEMVILPGRHAFCIKTDDETMTDLYEKWGGKRDEFVIYYKQFERAYYKNEDGKHNFRTLFALFIQECNSKNIRSTNVDAIYGLFSKFYNGVKSSLRSFANVAQYKNLEDLKKRMSAISFIVKKSDCLDLPKQTFMNYYVELTDEQKTLYNDLCKNSMTEINGGLVTPTIALTKILRLHQICCGHLKDNDKVTHSIKSNRLDRLDEWMEEASGKIVIWSHYTYDIELITEHLKKKYGPNSTLTYYGNTKDDERARVKEVFKRGGEVDGLDFLVANDKTGGYGNNFTAITNSFYYSYDMDYNIHHQTQDRIYRIGQTEPVFYGYLIAKDTVDEKIKQVLEGKRSMSEMLTESNWKDIFKTI